MLKSRRRLSVTAFLLAIFATASSAAAGQDTNTIGPEQLKDFQLPGPRTTPPIVEPSSPAPAEPVVTLPPAATPPPPAATPRASSASPSPAATRPRPSPDTPAPTDEPTRQPEPSEVEPGVAQPAAPTVERELQAAETPAVPTPPSESRAEAPPRPILKNILWGGLIAALTLALLLAMRARHRRQLVADEDVYADRSAEPQDETDAVPAQALAAAPTAAVAAEPAERAWLELDLVAEKAAATDTEAVVHFDLVMRNVGATEAGNIRIDARMLNASAQDEVRTFLDGPIHDTSGSPHVRIAPGEEMKLASRLNMPKAEVREIKVQGRTLFVPVIAINVAYDWGENGKGRSSKSWLIGRETAADQKMGAFRLDLGPRIYRSVGRRDAAVARMV